MKSILSIIAISLIIAGCGTVRPTPKAGYVHISGNTYDTVTGKPLNGTFVINTTRGGGVVCDSLGNFSIDVHDGDSLHFEYVGMKERTIRVCSADSTKWRVAMDTLKLILIDKGIKKSE